MVTERDTSVKASAIDDNRVGIVELLSSRSLRLPLFICVAAHLSQQLSGMVAIFQYSTGFFEASGVAPGDAPFATLGVGAVMVFMTLVTIPLMDRLGRRTLHLTGLGGMFVFR
jgi:SP family facilitated glucose transporter-like MFS transporter 1